MKRSLPIIAAVILTTFVAAPVVAEADAWDSCRLNRGGQRWNHRDVKREIRCGVKHWSVPGGRRHALCVARHESGFGAYAVSPTDDYGVYQHHRPYWRSRQNAYDKRRPSLRNIGESVFNGRANVLVAIRMAHASGWGAWAADRYC